MTLQTPEVEPTTLDRHEIGKCWAALRGQKVESFILMAAPTDVNYTEFRVKALECLSLVGDVKAGVIFRKDDKVFFSPARNTHSNRSKTPRPLPVYEVVGNL